MLNFLNPFMFVRACSLSYAHAQRRSRGQTSSNLVGIRPPRTLLKRSQMVDTRFGLKDTVSYSRTDEMVTSRFADERKRFVSC